MTPTAATATGLAVPWPALLVALALAAATTYAVSCWVWPFAACWRCHGAGKHARRDGRVWRPCRRCKGSGARLRIGRRVANAIQRRRRDGTPRATR